MKLMITLSQTRYRGLSQPNPVCSFYRLTNSQHVLIPLLQLTTKRDGTDLVSVAVGLLGY